MIEGYVEFEFDLPDALLKHLVRALDNMDSAPLTYEAVRSVPETQGVYQLFYEGRLVYIGKTDAEAGLQKRLSRHAKKIQHRINLNPAEVRFKAVRVFVFTAIDLESQLIRHYYAGGDTGWNNRGFGSNDPGRRRDKTKIKSINFDWRYPIDIDLMIDHDFSAYRTVAELLSALKNILPYTLRFEVVGRTPVDELRNKLITLPAGPISVRSIMDQVIRVLEPGWQATAFRHQILLYKEIENNYPDADILGRS